MKHAITWPDVFEGRAEVEISPEALLRLAEAAGAPWNLKDPDAKLSELQKEIITAPERTVVLFGGSRGGKSVAGACIALGQLMVPNSSIALIGLNYEHCSKEFDYIWRGFFKLFPRSACTESKNINAPPHFAMRITTIWGSSVRVFSTTSKDGAQVLGNEFDLAVLCEAAQVAPDVYNTKVERALLGRAKQKTGSDYLRRTGRAILLTTPKQQGGASYDLYNRALQRTKGKLGDLRLEALMQKVDPQRAWFESLYFCQANVRELNPTYPIEAFEHARRTLPKYSFEEQFLGKAVIRSGLCYSSFSEEKHVIPREKLPSLDVLRRSRFGVGIDTGREYASVLACITPEGAVYVLGEARETGGNTQQKAAATMAMVDEVLQDIFPSPKEAVEMWIIDVNSQNIDDLEQFLDVSFYAQKYDVLESLGHLDMRMGNGEIYIVEDLEFLLHEMRGYRFRVPKEMQPNIKDKPVGEDHLLDAMRYLLMQLFEHGPQPETPATWTVDQMLEKDRERLMTPNFARDMEAIQRRQWGNVLEGNW